MRFLRSPKFSLIFAMIIFSTIGIVRKNILLPSAVISFFRALIGTLCLLIYKILFQRTFDLNVVKENVIPLVISGIFLGGNWTMLFEAYQYTYVSIATMCYYMAPLIMIIFARIFFKESFSKYKVLCIVGAVVGMFLLTDILHVSVVGVKGIVYGLISAVMYACVVMMNKKIHHFSPIDRTLLQLGIASIVLVPYILLKIDFSVVQVNAHSMFYLLMAGIIHTGLAYVLYFGSLEKLPTDQVALFSYLDPILAVLLSIFLLGEQLHLLQLVGVCIVLVSIILCDRIR